MVFALACSLASLLLLNVLTLRWLVEKILTLDQCVIIFHVDGEENSVPMVFHDIVSMCDHFAC